MPSHIGSCAEACSCCHQPCIAAATSNINPRLSADLDHTNEGLRKGIVDWMNWLKEDVGFTNWRFDFVKGYGVSSHSCALTMSC